MFAYNRYIEINEPVDVLASFSPSYEHHFKLHTVKWRGVSFPISEVKSVMSYDYRKWFLYDTRPEKFTCHYSMIALIKDSNKAFSLHMHILDLNWTLYAVGNE